MTKPVVVGIGELMWDMLPEGKRAGGAPINFVYNATQLGADDSFSAGFVMGLLTGKSMREAHKQAVATAAFVCTKSGAWPEYE